MLDVAGKSLNPKELQSIIDSDEYREWAEAEALKDTHHDREDFDTEQEYIDAQADYTADYWYPDLNDERSLHVFVRKFLTAKGEKVGPAWN